MARDYLQGFVRHVATTAGGYLMGSGILTQSEMEAIAGGIATAVGVAWSLLDKKMKA